MTIFLVNICFIYWRNWGVASNFMSQYNMHPNVNNNINDRSDNKTYTHIPCIVTATRFNSIAIDILHLVAEHTYTHSIAYIWIDKKSVFTSPWYLSYTQIQIYGLLLHLARTQQYGGTVSSHCHHMSMYTHTKCICVPLFFFCVAYSICLGARFTL